MNSTKADCGDALTYLRHGNLAAAKKTVGYDFAPIVLEKIRDIYYDQGVTLLKQNQYDKAITNFENAIAIDAGFSEGYVRLQDAYLGFEGYNLRQLETEQKDFEKDRTLGQISESIEFLGETTNINSADTYIDAPYQANETKSSEGYSGSDQSALTSWIQRTADPRLLTREEEIELAKRIEVGKTSNVYTADAEQARNQLVQANLRLVISIARKYYDHNIPLEDLIQEGNIGLIKAASKFDYRDGFKFSNYAKQWIKWEIMHALDNSSRLIRLPSYFIKRITEFDAVYATLCQKLQREPYREEIAEALDLTVAQVEEIIMSKVDSVSMDFSIGSERSVETVGDLIDDLIEDSTMSEHEGPIAEMINEDLIVHFFTELPEREQNVLKMRFGLEDGERKTLREISVALGVTRERVRQLEIEAIKRLRVLYDEMGEFQSDQSWAGKTTV